MTSCAANLPTKSETNITSVIIRSPTGVCSAGKPCSITWRAALKKSAVLIVEIDESKIGRRKYNRGHPVDGQWVFGGVERGSGRTFLVPVPDRTADTLVAIIREWIEPGMTVISDCWGCLSQSRVGVLHAPHRQS